MKAEPGIDFQAEAARFAYDAFSRGHTSNPAQVKAVAQIYGIGVAALNVMTDIAVGGLLKGLLPSGAAMPAKKQLQKAIYTSL